MGNHMLPPDGGPSPFDAIKLIDPDGHEYWRGRDLARVLGYANYRNFELVVGKGRVACQQSGHDPEDHFVDVNEMVPVGSGAHRKISNVWLSRYACYLVVQNADPTGKPIVAQGQTYFALQTRRQEIEDGRRLMLRGEMKEHNKKLAGAAKEAGVVEPKDYAIFQNKGYMGLYDGRGVAQIRAAKGLMPKQDILDHMGSTELAANLFRATQTEEKLKREGIKGKAHANQAHYEVGKKVRQTMRETGGVMPEDLPAVESIKEVEKRQKRLDKGVDSD